MKKSTFLKLKIFEYDDDLTLLNVDDCFLMGENVSEQKLNITDISVISYYKIISKKGNTVSYITEIEKLEE
jgi:hypothetical protein